MTNEILEHSQGTHSETLRRLPKDQKRNVGFRQSTRWKTLCCENSFLISTEEVPAKGVLREATAGSLEVRFRYTAEDHSIIITDVAANHEMAL